MNKTKQDSIQKHIVLTYVFLRLGIGTLAIALPVILSVLGFIRYGLVLQDSLSAYYHAYVPTSQLPDVFSVAGNGVMRNWFVGILWAIGFFLILYQGFGRRESKALNAAGVLLVMVAMFPMDWTCHQSCPKISIHGVSAILFFFSIGYVCIFRSGDTLNHGFYPGLLDKDRRFYRRWYRVIGSAMWIFPLFVAALEFAKIRIFGTHAVFFIEAGGIWVFAAYWLLKSKEIAASGADYAAINGQLYRPSRKANPIAYWLDNTPLNYLPPPPST